jgi:fibronectin type 3 domain-containing protein
MFRKVFLLSVVLLLSPMVAYGAAVTLAWDANTEADLAGYKIYYGTASRDYSDSIDVGNTTQYTLADLDDGVTYYLAATAYDAATNESAYSVELVHTTGNPDNIITASAGANGSISPSGSLTVSHGSNQTFTISADTAYHIQNVLVDGVSVGAVSTYTFTNVTRNYTIAASFTVDNQPPAANAGPDQTVNEGVVVKLKGNNSVLRPILGTKSVDHPCISQTPVKSKPILYHPMSSLQVRPWPSSWS